MGRKTVSFFSSRYHKHQGMRVLLALALAGHARAQVECCATVRVFWHNSGPGQLGYFTKLPPTAGDFQAKPSYQNVDNNNFLYFYEDSNDWYISSTLGASQVLAHSTSVVGDIGGAPACPTDAVGWQSDESSDRSADSELGVECAELPGPCCSTVTAAGFSDASLRGHWAMMSTEDDQELFEQYHSRPVYTRTRAGDGALYLLYSRAIRDWAIISSRQWTDGSAILGLPLRAQSGGNDPSALCPDTADWTHNHTTPYGQATFEPASAVALVTEHLCSRPVASISDCSAVAAELNLDVATATSMSGGGSTGRPRGCLYRPARDGAPAQLLYNNVSSTPFFAVNCSASYQCVCENSGVCALATPAATRVPTAIPTSTSAPTAVPTAGPSSSAPSSNMTTASPSPVPSEAPTMPAPTSHEPTSAPSLVVPTSRPVTPASSAPAAPPNPAPAPAPTLPRASSNPTASPTQAPTRTPSGVQTAVPITSQPTVAPSTVPPTEVGATFSPTLAPTAALSTSPNPLTATAAPIGSTPSAGQPPAGQPSQPIAALTTAPSPATDGSSDEVVSSAESDAIVDVLVITVIVTAVLLLAVGIGLCRCRQREARTIPATDGIQHQSSLDGQTGSHAAVTTMPMHDNPLRQQGPPNGPSSSDRIYEVNEDDGYLHTEPAGSSATVAPHRSIDSAGYSIPSSDSGPTGVRVTEGRSTDSTGYQIPQNTGARVTTGRSTDSAGYHLMRDAAAVEPHYSAPVDDGESLYDVPLLATQPAAFGTARQLSELSLRESHEQWGPSLMASSTARTRADDGSDPLPAPPSAAGAVGGTSTVVATPAAGDVTNTPGNCTGREPTHPAPVSTIGADYRNPVPRLAEPGEQGTAGLAAQRAAARPYINVESDLSPDDANTSLAARQTDLPANSPIMANPDVAANAPITVNPDYAAASTARPPYINVESDLGADAPLAPNNPIMSNPGYAAASTARPPYINVESDLGTDASLAAGETDLLANHPIMANPNYDASVAVRPNLRSSSEPANPSPRPTLAERRRSSIALLTLPVPANGSQAGPTSLLPPTGLTPGLTPMDFAESPMPLSSRSPRSPIRQSQI